MLALAKGGKDKPKSVIVQNESIAVTVENDSIAVTTTEAAWEYRLVGFTAPTTGEISDSQGSGLYAMHRICAKEVAPNARACFTNEIQRPAHNTTFPVNLAAWVIPSKYVVERNSEGWIARDEGSGRVGESAISRTGAKAILNCVSYTSDSSTFGQLSLNGTVMFDSGGMGASSCTLSNPIACCAPVAIPVQ